MENLNSIIDSRRLQLLLKYIKPTEKKKLNKRLNKLYRGFSTDTLKFIELLDRFNNANLSSDNLPPYTVGKRRVIVINNDYKVNKAVKDILTEQFIGFDTEQRPTFTKGEKQKDIALIQIATKKFCYLIQTKLIKDITPILDILTNKTIIKVGFDLKNDIKEMEKQLGIVPKNIFDMSAFMKNGLLHRNQIGVKNSMALIMEQKMKKSKKIAMSNWENRDLNSNQIKYASEDATAPYDIYEHIQQNFPLFL